MAGEEKNFIFRIAAETSGFEKAISDARKLERALNTTARNLSRTIIAPSGLSARSELLLRDYEKQLRAFNQAQKQFGALPSSMAPRAPAFLSGGQSRIILPSSGSGSVYPAYSAEYAKYSRPAPTAQQKLLTYQSQQALPYYRPQALTGPAQQKLLTANPYSASGAILGQAPSQQKLLTYQPNVSYPTLASRGSFQSKDLTPQLEEQWKKAPGMIDEVNKKQSQFIKWGLRAVEVVPVWMAVRSAYQALINTITSGVQTIVESNKELTRIKIALSPMKDVGAVLKEIETSATQMALATGHSVGEVIRGFYSFKDAGLSVEDSMAGMSASVKGAQAGFTDVVETSKTLADMMVLIGDKIDNVRTPTEKMEYALGLIAIQQKNNKFQWSELTEGLGSFLAMGTNVGLTLEEIIVLLTQSSTYMQRGSKGGRELSRAFADLESKMSLVATLLNKDESILKATNRFDLMVEVITELNKRAGGLESVFGDVDSLFGSVGARSIAGFVTQIERLKSESEKLKEVYKNPFEAIKELNSQAKEASNTYESLLKQIGQTQAQVGKTFIEAALQTNTFVEVLKIVKIFLSGIVAELEAIKKLGGFAAILPGSPVLGFNVAKNIVNRPPKRNEFQDIADEAGKKDSDKYKADEAGKKDSDKYKADQEPKRLQDISERHEYQELLIRRKAALGYNQIAIEKMILVEMLKQDASLQDLQKIDEQRLKIIEMTHQEVISLSQEFKSTFSEGLAGLLKQETSIKDFFGRIGTYWKDTFYKQVAEGLTENLFTNTGIGEIFGEGMFGIKNMLSGNGDGSVQGSIKSSFDYGAKLSYDMIVKGFQIGNLTASGGGGGGGGGWFGGGGSGNRGNIGSMISGLYDAIIPAQYANTSVGGANTLVAPANYYQLRNSGGGGWGNMSTYGSLMRNGVGGRTGGLGKAAGTAGMIYEGYQMSYGQGNRIDWMNDPVLKENERKAAYRLSGGGNQYGNVGNWQLRRAGGSKNMQTFWNIFDSGGAVTQTGLTLKKWFQGEKRTETGDNIVNESRVASKIDVTNKTLELVNRNLIALRQDIREYLLPSSAYFSEARNLGDEFSIQARRGLA